MADLTPQRTYQAACPACGAMLSFRSASSTHAVCGYCNTTVVRSGDVLEKIGIAAQIFEDYSQLQLYAQGEFEGAAFTLVGRLQYAASAGRWTEWLALFDDGKTIVLSEDNGDFVLMQAVPAAQLTQFGSLGQSVPLESNLILGNTLNFLYVEYSVSALHSVQLVAAQGEFNKPPVLNTPFTLAELRSNTGKLVSIAYDISPPALPSVYLGKAVILESLNLTGLKESSNLTVAGRQFNCPQCASPITVQLDSSKAITCMACNSLIDLSQGVGGELRYAMQHEPIRPQIALGSIGTFQSKQWQVVGYQHRVAAADDDDEAFGWEEYLLYNAKAGFQFLVDSTEGWSLVKPATGVGVIKPDGSALYLGTRYTSQAQYSAQTDYVAGEFYWPVQRGYQTVNQDFASGNSLLNREQAGAEIVWSVGSRLSSEAVVQAFNIPAAQAALFKRDAAPHSLSRNTVLIGVIVLVLLASLVMLVSNNNQTKRCRAEYNLYSTLSQQQQLDQCKARNNYNNSLYNGSYGGSYGGYSSGGGGHK